MTVGDFCGIPKYLSKNFLRESKGRLPSVIFSFNSSLFHVASIFSHPSFNPLDPLMRY